MPWARSIDPSVAGSFTTGMTDVRHLPLGSVNSTGRRPEYLARSRALVIAATLSTVPMMSVGKPHHPELPNSLRTSTRNSGTSTSAATHATAHHNGNGQINRPTAAPANMVIVVTY